MDIILKPDQQELYQKSRGAWKAHTRFIIYAQTGAGKTIVSAFMIREMAKNGLRILFTVPRTSLISQTADRFILCGIEDITLMWADYETDPHAAVTVGSLDTVIRRDFSRFDVIFMDEAHHRRKAMLEYMLESPNQRVIGLTATPFPPWMGEYYQGLVKSESMRWMIDNGRLCDYKLYIPGNPSAGKAKLSKNSYGEMDYTSAQSAKIMDKPTITGNIVEYWLENGENRSTMVAPSTVEHANGICIGFEKAGVRAEVISSATPIESRLEIFDLVEREIVKILISVDCISEGLDIPILSCCIIARKIKSLTRIMQIVGRVLRDKPEDYRFQDSLIFDHSGSFEDIGMRPEDITIDALETGDDGLKEVSKRKKKAKTEEKKAKKCPSCNFLKPAGVYECPECKFKPKQGEMPDCDESGTLVSFDKVKAKITKEQKQKFYSELLGYRREKLAKGGQCSEGWVGNTYKDKFGVWPRGLEAIAMPASKDVRNYITSRKIAYWKSKAKASK